MSDINARVKQGRPVQHMVVEVPGHPLLKVRVYGYAQAKTHEDQQEQSYVVLLNGEPTARAELAPTEKEAVMQLLRDEFPEHAKI